MHVAGGGVWSKHMPKSLLAFERKLEGQSISHEAVRPQGHLGYPNDWVAIHTNILIDLALLHGQMPLWEYNHSTEVLQIVKR